MQETLENKIVITSEKVYDIKDALEECFASDIDLLNRYHIESPAPLFTCVERTYADLRACPNICFYKLFELSKLIGYFCKETDKYGNLYLTGFFLKPDCRTKEHKKGFWDVVCKEFGEPFLVGVYEKNVRATKFLEKSGAKVFFRGLTEFGESFVSYKMN